MQVFVSAEGSVQFFRLRLREAGVLPLFVEPNFDAPERLPLRDPAEQRINLNVDHDALEKDLKSVPDGEESTRDEEVIGSIGTADRDRVVEVRDSKRVVAIRA